MHYRELHILFYLGEKLDNVERRLDEMNVDLKRADKNLKEIEKVCGCCSCPGGPRSVTVREREGLLGRRGIEGGKGRREGARM